MQYPTFVGDAMLKLKLDWMDAIKQSEPNDKVIQITIPLYDETVISTKLIWTGSIRTLFADFAALFIFCHDTFKPNMSKFQQYLLKLTM